MKVKKLFLVLSFALFALFITGCFDLNEVKTLTFVQTPQSIYYVVGSADAERAQQEVLENVIVKADGTEFTLQALKEVMGATVAGLDLATPGTHTLVIKYGGVTLTYVYKVVTDLGQTLFAGGSGKQSDPYKISNVQQFKNMFTRVYGIAAPAKLDLSDGKTLQERFDDESEKVGVIVAEAAWRTYYQACFPFFTTGVHYELTADLDFDGMDYTPLGALGGENYIPFTGSINGAKVEGGNYSIKNVTISAIGDISGMFAGLYGAKIINIDLVNIKSDINTFSKYAAALASFAFGEVSSGPTEKVTYLTNVNLKQSQIFAQRSGGIFSDADSFIVKNCSIDGDTVIGASQYAGAVTGKSNPTRVYSFYKLHFLTKTQANNIEFNGENYTMVIDNFQSNARVYGPVKGLSGKGFLASTTPYPVVYTSPSSTSNSINEKDPNVQNPTKIYLGLITYSSILTGNSNRAIILPNVDVYNAWTVNKTANTANVAMFFQNEEELNSKHWPDPIVKVKLMDGKVYIDNRLAIYDADGFEMYALYHLASGSGYVAGINESKYQILFDNGVVCGVVKESAIQ